MTAKIAILIDKYHLTLDQISELTDYQIDKIYFHKRDKEGIIMIPEYVEEIEDKEPTEDECLMKLLQIKPMMLENDYWQAVENVKAKFRK